MFMFSKKISKKEQTEPLCQFGFQKTFTYHRNENYYYQPKCLCVAV